MMIIKPIFSLGQVKFQGWKDCQWEEFHFFWTACIILILVQLTLSKIYTNKSHMRLPTVWLLGPTLTPKSSDYDTTKKKKITYSLHFALVKSTMNAPAPKASKGFGGISRGGWWALRGRRVGFSFTFSLPLGLLSVPVMWNVLNLFHFDPLIQHLVPHRMLISFLGDRRCVGAGCVSRAFKMTQRRLDDSELVSSLARNPLDGRFIRSPLAR